MNETYNSDKLNEILNLLIKQAAEQRRLERSHTLLPQQQQSPAYPYESPGERIARLRKKRKMTQQHLACSLGICTSSLSKYENNMLPFRTDLLVKIARELHTTPYYILGISPKIKKQTGCAAEEALSQEELLLKIFRSLSPEHRRLFLDCAIKYHSNLMFNGDYYLEAGLYHK